MISNEKTEISCFHYSLKLLSKYYDFDYSMIFLELLGFKYNSDSNLLLGENLDLCWIKNEERRRYILKRYHGIEYEIIDRGIMDINDMITEEPVIAYFDSFYCTWLPFFEKQHFNHSILVWRDNNNILFSDQFSKNQILDEHFITKNLLKVIKIKSINKRIVNERKEYLKEINKSIRYYFNINSVKNYLDFLKDLKRKFVVSNEINFSNPLSSKFLMQMKFIGEDRYNITKSLEYIESKTGVSLKKTIHFFIEVSKLYEETRFYILKCGYANKSIDDNYVYNQIKKAFVLEQSAILALIDLLY